MDLFNEIPLHGGRTVGRRYTYTPLPEGRWIRLLRLQPGAFEDPIEVTLTVVELFEEIPAFEAISYAWEDPDDTRAITYDEKVLRPTTSLFEALRRFRKATQPRVLWADAISIDQSDPVERGHQVDITGLIFSKLDMCLYGLAKTPEVDAETFRLMDEVNKYYGAEYDKIRHSRDFRHTSSPYHDLNALSNPSPSTEWLWSAHWKGLQILFEARWLSRVWVLQ